MPDLTALGAFGYRTLPYWFAIWLVLMSDFLSGYLKRMVDEYVERKKAALKDAATKDSRGWSQWDEDVVESERIFVKNFVSDSVLRVNFLNAMLAAFISTIAATAATRSFTWLAIGLVSLVACYAPLLGLLLKLGPAGLVARELHFEFWGKPHTIAMAPYVVYRIVLIVVNVVLIIITALSQAFPVGIQTR